MDNGCLASFISLHGEWNLFHFRSFHRGWCSWSRDHTLTACLLHTNLYAGKKDFYLDITTVEERRTEGEALTENARRKENVRKKERKLSRTVFTLTTVFLACWIPDFVFDNLNKACSCFKFPVLQALLVALPPLLNPLCYSLCTAKFRRALLKLIWSGLLNHKNYYTFRC